MIRPFFVFLAPLGCLLMLVFSALTPFRMLASLGEMLQPEPTLSNVTALAPVGGLGAVLFGLGITFLTLLRRKPTMFARLLLFVAAVLFVAGAASNLFGDWLMMSAFQSLASAEQIDAERFTESFQPAKLSMLAGYAMFLVASLSVSAAATKMETKSLFVPTSVTFAMISLVLLLLAVWWGQSAISAFPEIIANESVEPTQVAGSINGTLQSNFLFQVSVVGFAASTLVVALAHRK